MARTPELAERRLAEWRLATERLGFSRGHVLGLPDRGLSGRESDIAAGMYAYSSILAALLERGRTGRGAHLDVSMLEATVEWMGFPLYYAYDGAEPPPRAGAPDITFDFWDQLAAYERLEELKRFRPSIYKALPR